MRRSGWLILAAIVCIVVLVGATYLKRKETLVRAAPAPPPRLEKGLDGKANDWCTSDSSGTTPRYKICAHSFQQVNAPSVMELEGVELQLFHDEGQEFDLVQCASAKFDMSAKTLYSEGEVDITLHQPADGTPPQGRIVKIHSSGVHFESESGKAYTDRPAEFEFDQGGGSATGAEYDPNSRELHLKSRVKLDLRGKTADSKPMHVEAGEAYYKERESYIALMPWSKLSRDTLRMEAGVTVVKLDEGMVRTVEAQGAHGVQDQADRKVEFAADHLNLHFNDSTQVDKIQGEWNAKLISTASTMRTTVTGDRVNLDFAASAHDTVLTSAAASGKGMAEAKPIAKPGEAPGDTRVLHSDTIHLKMREGGQEIESVATDGPGTVDFLPNRPGQPKRLLKGDRIWITYGAENRIQSFRSINATTRTDKPAVPGRLAPAPVLTASKEIVATFDPKTSDLSKLEQKNDFRYDEGSRHATADRAALDEAQDVMTLETAARLWDDTGSTIADRVVLNQKSGDFTAEGHVASTRLPDKKGSSSAMLSNDEVMQARAQRMTSTNKNERIFYDGNAVAWQGANRVQADHIQIDRERKVLEAHGNVTSQFADQKKNQTSDAKAAPVKRTSRAAPPVFTVVVAPDLIYDEETRIANYTGGVNMSRPGLTGVSREIRAFLKEAGSDSSLDKAFAEGTVKVTSTGEKRTRTGTSEHGEYYADEQKVILVEGDPTLVDSVKGTTRGKQLTWFSNNDRLLVNGVESRPADSLLRKK